MPCPITRSLVLNFTPPTPAPANGYRVKWRVVGTTQYTTAAGPFTSSPITLTNIPACDNIEGTIESSCSTTSFSAPASFSANKITALGCGSSVNRSQTTTTFYTYPKELVDLIGVTAQTVDVQWVSNDVPNRINVYDANNTLIASTGWKGVAAYTGPWSTPSSPNLNTATSGTLTFDRTLGDGRYFSINAETAGHATLEDNWQATIACTAGAGGGGGGVGTSTYAVTPSVTSVNEGSSVVFTINTQNVIDPSSLYYSIEGTVDAADFTDNTLTGTFVINNQQGSVTKTLANDTTTEGPQTLIFRVRTGSVTGPIVATASTVTVVDTSTAGSPATPTYTLLALNQSSEQITAINEGNNLTIRLNTTNVQDGTTVAYAVTGITSGDLAGNSDPLTGNFTIQNNTATKNFYIAADNDTDGTDTFVITLTGKNVSKSVTINDTSLTPSWTGYSLTPSLDDVNCTTNGEPITVYKNNSAGSIVVGNTLYATQSLSNPLTSGTYTDGTNKYTVQAGGSVSAKVTCGTGGGTQTEVYTLTSSVEAVNEGGEVTFFLQTQNVSALTPVPYTVTGITTADLASDQIDGLTGNFVSGSLQGSKTSITFKLKNDYTADGTETITVTLTGKGVSKSVTVNDTSTAPTAYQVLIEDNQYSTEPITCLGNSYTQTNYRTTVTLKDGSGNTVNAPANVNVVIEYIYNPCFGSSSAFNQTITIPAGQSTAYYQYIHDTIVDCGQSNCEPEGNTLNKLVSVTNNYMLASGSVTFPNALP